MISQPTTSPGLVDHLTALHRTVSSPRHDSAVFPVKYSTDQGAGSSVTNCLVVSLSVIRISDIVTGVQPTDLFQCLISEVEIVVVKYWFSVQTKSNDQSTVNDYL